MRAILLAAGYGTRLYPLTKNHPKPLLPVGDRSILSRIISRVEPVEEVQSVHVVSNDRFVDQFRDWESTLKTHLDIEVLNDGTQQPEDRLGAIGDLQFAIEEIQPAEDVMVIAGDNLILFPLEEFVSFSRQHGTVIGVKDMGDQEVNDYSVVKLNNRNQVVDFEEKPPNPSSSLISIGLYLFKNEHLPRIEEYLETGKNPDEPGYLIQWLHQVEEVYGYRIDGRWYDIGDIRSYNNANEFYERKEENVRE